MTTTVRERPIIMPAEDVRALLDRRKTQVRRAVKALRQAPLPARWDASAHGELRFVGSGLVAVAPSGARSTFPLPTCPFGAPGGRLWVREAYAWMDGQPDRAKAVLWYAATDAETAREMNEGADPGDLRFRWTAPRLMPRWASRLTLEVTAVRVERLQSITDAEVNPWTWIVEFRRLGAGE